MELSDKEMIDMLQDPHTRREGFAVLVRQYSEPLYWKVRRIVLNHEDANDVLQNAFLKIWNNLDTFQGKSALSTWLYRIAYNTCIDELRRRRGVVSLDTLREGGFDVPDATAERAYEQLEHKERCELVKQAMEQLPEDQRAALVLREFQQLSYEEIANALQQPEGTIKSRINRAREKVKNFVKQAEQNGRPSVKENEGRQK